MKNKKIVKKLFAGVMAMSLCLGTTMVAAAAPGEGDEKSATVSLTKELKIADGITTPGVTFTFEFQQDFKADGATAVEQEIKTKKLVFNENDKQVDGSIVKETKNLLNGITFPSAGMYVYKVTETAGETSIEGGTMTYDPQVYTLEVGVKNDNNGGTVVDNAVVKKEGAEEGDKADGTPTGGEEGDSDNKDDQNTNGKGNEFRFTNTFTKKTGGEDPDKPVIDKPDTKDSALTVSKKVVAKDTSNINPNQEFTFNITLTYPATADESTKGEAIEAYIINKDKNCKAIVSLNEGADKEFKLLADEYLTFKSLPAGTTYKVTETGTNNYTGAITTLVNNKDKEATTVTGEKSQNVTVEKGLVGEVVNGNRSDVTNTYDDQAATPTGILVNNLPYIAIILVAVVGCVVIVAGRKRRAN